MSKDLVTNVFTLKQLFEMPIKAVIDANEYAAKSAVNFIREFGFTAKKTKDDWGDLKMVRFSYEFLQNGERKKMVVEIPIISMIPLPLLEVKRANFDFAIRILDKVTTGITHSVDEVTIDEPSTNVLALLVPDRKTQLGDRFESSLVSNMNVHVEVERSDIPAGLLELMNLAQGALSGEEKKSLLITTDPDYLTFAGSDREQTLTIRVVPNKPRQTDIAVTIQVIGSTDTATSLFDESVRISKGRVVGHPTLPKLIALCSPEGEVSITFRATANTGNGFIKITCEDSAEHRVYYELTH